MKYILLSLLLFIAGCGYIEQAKQKIGLGKSTQQLQQEQEAEKDLFKKKVEAALAESRSADSLVQQWADRLAEGDKFEGLTDSDPWGKRIRIVYTQDWFERVLDVRSAGPDVLFDTEDDLFRTRKQRDISAGMLSLFRTFGPVLVIWAIVGALALLATKIKGRHKSKKHPTISALAIIAISPIILVVYLVMGILALLVGVLGGDGDGFDGGFDFFDIDIDFNLFGD